MKKINLNYCLIMILISFTSIMYSQTTLPIIGFNDPNNYTIGHFSVPGSSGLDIHWFGGIRFGDSTSRSVMQITNGNLGIGTETPAAKLDVAGGFYVGNGSVNANTTKVFLRNPAGKTWALSSGANANTESSFSIYNWTDNKSTPVFHIGSAGNIGIGISNPLNKLDVNGTIHSKEVKVDMDGWADFVFKNEYNLPTLAEVETHIKEKGHLENIPNEEEVLKNGISLGEMNVKLLQKIEELTLYVIEQNKEIKNLKNQNQILKEFTERVVELENKIK